MKKIAYKEGYKYQLVDDYVIALPIPYQDKEINTNYLSVTNTGVLTIKRGYAWDGPSGPTIDTLNSMRASLVHDALYQLIRLKYFPSRYKTLADDIFYKILTEDGMTRLRASIWHKALDLFGGKNILPEMEKPIKLAP